MKQDLSKFAMRIQLLVEDFTRLQNDFEAWDDEAACAWCNGRGEIDENCEHCGAPFCAKCWENMLAEKKEKAP